MSELTDFQEHCKRMQAQAERDGRLRHAQQWADLSGEISTYIEDHQGGILSPAVASDDELLLFEES